MSFEPNVKPEYIDNFAHGASVSRLPATRALGEFVTRYRPLLVLTGAGCSTASGIPGYRDRDGRWKHAPPTLYQDFVRHEYVRRRYWARGMAGYGRMREARPNGAHRALARLERDGIVTGVVTQNVDGLHQKAGSASVIDLHGRLDKVACLTCGHAQSRDQVHRWLLEHNPHLGERDGSLRPDGDASLPQIDPASVSVPGCPLCAGILKPDVVFFGESVPRTRVETARRSLQQSAALLVVGSSLTVYSGYRFCRWARAVGKPVAAVNLGRTRADPELALKLDAPCGPVLSRLVVLLGS